MVLSKMYSGEHIVIPDKISNLLKTYAKAAVKTQPYDLLRWSAAYFRCLSMNVSPPVKARYEKDNTEGSITRGYLRVLISQVKKGYYIDRVVLENFWHGLCLPEEELLKYLTLTRMLYWPKIHWLKLFAVIVGSINENFHETIYMLCELLSEEPEGSSSPVPFWMFKEIYYYLAELDCTESQTFFDGRKVLSDKTLETELPKPELPKKLSGMLFRNTMINFWKFRIEHLEKKIREESERREKEGENVAPLFQVEELMIEKLETDPNFQLVGELNDPKEIVKKSLDFESTLEVFQQLEIKDPETQDPEMIYKKAKETEQEIDKLKAKVSKAVGEQAIKFHENQIFNIFKNIGPPWNWLFEFSCCDCKDKSYNFLEIQSEPESDDESQHSEKAKSRKTSAVTINDDHKSIASAGTTISNFTIEDIEEVPSSNPHRVLVDIICAISESLELRECDIKENSSIKQIIRQQFDKNVLSSADHERLVKFMDAADTNGTVFKDLNELYNYFIQESSKERFSDVIEIREEGESSESDEDVVTEIEKKKPASADKSREKNDKIVSIFKESGIEVDGKLLDAKVSERMILGLVDKPLLKDSASDITSDNMSVSSSSQAETVKLNRALSKETEAQTTPFIEQCHERRAKSASEKTKSARSVKKEPFTCKIQPMPGIGSKISQETIENFIKFMMVRSFEQNGLIYPRNFSEQGCPNMCDEPESLKN